MSWSVVCDKGRESPIQFLTQHAPDTVEIKCEQINVGDYAIFKDQKLIITIERKTWSDLAATIRDPIRKENHNKLLDLREACGARIVYLIEGHAYPSPNAKFCRIPFPYLQAYLDHIMIRDSCSIIYAKDIQGSALRILALVKHMQSLDKTNFDFGADVDATDAVYAGDDHILLKQSNMPSDDAVINSVWMSINGITANSVLKIRENFIFLDLSAPDVAAKIADIKYSSGRKLGSKQANAIVKSASRKLTHIKMLSKINGVTSDTAEKILNIYKITDLHTIAMDDLANVEKKQHINAAGNIKSVKVGKALAKRIINIFQHVNENREIAGTSDEAGPD